MRWVLFLIPLMSCPVLAQLKLEPIDPQAPVDVLYRNLLKEGKKAAPAIKTLAKAHDSFENRQFTQAKALAAQTSADSVVGDYSIYLQAVSSVGLSEVAFKNKKFKESLSEAEKALELFFSIERKFPNSGALTYLYRDIARTELLVADAKFALDQKELSKRTYEKALLRIPIKEFVPLISWTSILNYSNLCRGKKRDDTCNGWIQQFFSLYPLRSKEYGVLSKQHPALAEVQKNQRANYQTGSYKSPDKDQELFDQTFSAYLGQEYGTSTERFQEILEKYPKSELRQRTAYWLGKSYQKKDDSTSASEAFSLAVQISPISFYGLMSAFELKKDPGVFVDTEIPFGEILPSSLDPKEKVSFNKAQKFLQSGLLSFAAMELNQIKASSSMSNEFVTYLTYLNFKSQNTLQSYRFVDELIKRGTRSAFSTWGLQIIFPAYFWEEIQKHAGNAGLDPLLVMSLMKQESAFRREAISSSGAMGLIQLMPFTAIDIDAQVFQSDVKEIDTNLRIGTQYLSRVIRQFDGNIVYALAGYNAGPNRVKQWLKERPGITDPVEFIESIPYSETRGYVASILRNYYWYNEQIKGEKLTSLDLFWKLKAPK